MSARLRGIARNTQEIVDTGHYVSPNGRTVSLAEAVFAARAGTRLHGPGPLTVVPDTDRVTAFEVTGESSTAAARRLTERDGAPVAVLNFASARNPGGGFLNGAQAQEEALCRASALHTTLLQVPAYYEHHRADRSPFYSDRVIHSPAVPVFRDDRGGLLDTPFRVGFLTSPAPNAGVIARSLPEQVPLIPAALAARAERVLQTAAVHGYRRLVLGAWGCGVFRNDPAEVAGAFHALLTGDGAFAGHFDEVVLAILDRTGEQRTLAAFRRVFAA
ncbi:TIGR02452 family protein [Streptomyces clavuligerus]|uniref:TIGR02452 family protein n=1 Tax=Streptomyces clavuligerus TaxID=1901 RepID=UPI0008106A34|nr:TIGR02452 family protein [Streptomyces clavuligerus]ANW17033.1 TIGR02452 family protein [Streptomyces clavuligerus]AXU11568.1 TIGR02452 family protein [Streptomyces clavuligerus]MBY6301389.1 TIGR02452 family protein [Streptomyces clavuligerus]QPL61686.1 TIGR02452 family protein [Streptomyces clavuligerus]QPL67721.1 TIGR02452 family protein [Streptomyces clavuligerus]